MFLVALLIFLVGYTVKDVQKTSQSLELKQVQLKVLERQYEQALKKIKASHQTKQQLDEANVKLQDLEKQKQSLEQQLQAKKAANTVYAATIPKTTASSGSVEDMVRAAAVKYGINPDYLARVARCESGFNPNSINYNYYAGGGHPSGVFQFIPSTWTRMSMQAGFAGASVFDAYSNVNVAAWAFANGRSGEWSCA